MRHILTMLLSMLLLAGQTVVASAKCSSCGGRDNSGRDRHCCECGEASKCDSCARCGGEYERMTLGYKQGKALREAQAEKDKEADRRYRESVRSECGCEKCAKEPRTKCNKCWRCKDECECTSKCRTGKCGEVKCGRNGSCGKRGCDTCNSDSGCDCSRGENRCKEGCTCKCQGNCECGTGRACGDCGFERWERRRGAGTTFLRDTDD